MACGELTSSTLAPAASRDRLKARDVEPQPICMQGGAVVANSSQLLPTRRSEGEVSAPQVCTPANV